MEVGRKREGVPELGFGAFEDRFRGE